MTSWTITFPPSCWARSVQVRKSISDIFRRKLTRDEDILDNKCSWVVNTALAVLDATGDVTSLTPPSYALGSNEAFKKAKATLSASRKAEMRAILDENYGRKDGVKEARVKAVFKELDILAIYNEYEESVYAKLKGEIEQIPEGDGLGLRRDVFTKFLNKIYKRQK
jgi:farnesyl diphosphate synthase